MANCEPYANGQGWWHVPDCPHVDWSEDYPEDYPLIKKTESYGQE